MGIRRKPGRRSLAVCTFAGCDDDATDTVGVTALCALHRSYITDMLDHKNQPGANLELDSFIDQWLVAETHGTRRRLPG